MLSLIESEACCEPGGFLWNDTRSVTHWVAKLLPGRLVGLTREGPRLASSSREEDADEPAGLDAKSHVALDQAKCQRPRRSPLLLNGRALPSCDTRRKDGARRSTQPSKLTGLLTRKSTLTRKLKVSVDFMRTGIIW